jgi:hypothetical protein
VWPAVAEISLLGGIGCGTYLVKKVLEEARELGEYEWVVLQVSQKLIM